MNEAELIESGWHVIRVWECEITTVAERYVRLEVCITKSPVAHTSMIQQIIQ